RAVLALLHETQQENLIDEVFELCIQAQQSNTMHEENFIKRLYQPFSSKQISDKIAEIITPKNSVARISVVYQTIENLHAACPGHLGDWYFSGNYPTPGGNGVVNQAFINFMENKSVRAY
ncbi:MAG TPA: amidophosphoribosyltransferase, partial [Catalimonadaceae bacterium]|nr:amidophosphoribosyltransferase [Catalimonadaceae bacterium]